MLKWPVVFGKAAVVVAVVAGVAACEEPSPPTTTTTTAEVRPGPDNTGPVNSCNRTISGSQLSTELAAGDVSDVCVNGGLTLKSTHSGRKLSNFTINGGGGLYGVNASGSGFTNVTFEDGKIFNVKSTGIYGGNFTARRLEVTESGADGFKPRNNSTIVDSYMHHMGTSVGAHADAFQFDGPDGLTTSNVLIDGNYCNLNISQRNETSPITGTKYNVNACIQLNGQINLVNVRATNNWFEGGNFSLNCGSPGRDQIVLSGNRFLGGWAYGPATGCPAQ